MTSEGSNARTNMSIPELQEEVVSLRTSLPKYIENVYTKINKHKLNVFEYLNYVTDTDDFKVPPISNPFESCNMEDLTISKDDSVEATLKTQMKMMHVLLVKMKKLQANTKEDGINK